MADLHSDVYEDGDDHEEINCLVVGETADGKSTLLCELLDPIYYADRPDEMPEKLDMASEEAGGTTDELASYRGITFENNGKTYRLRLYDTPGVGTEKCPVDELMAKIRAQFESGTKFQCIIATSPVGLTTPGAGAQAVRHLLQEGMCGSAKNPTSAWNHVIFVGTKGDLANQASHGRFQRAVVPKFFEHAPSDVVRLNCVTGAKLASVDLHGNATSIDISALTEKMGELPDLDEFFFESHGLTPELLEKIFRKLLRANGDPQKLAQRVEELTAREHQNLIHVPGIDKIRDEEFRIKAMLDGSPTDEEKEDVLKRQAYFNKYTRWRPNGGGTRITKTQVEKEFIEKGYIKDRPHGRYEGFPTVCPPKGNKLDIVWKMYEKDFVERLPEPPAKYKAAANMATAKPATAKPTTAKPSTSVRMPQSEGVNSRQNKRARRGTPVADAAEGDDDEDMDGVPSAPMRREAPSSKALPDLPVGARVTSCDRGNGTVIKLVGPWIHVDFGDGPVACRKSWLKMVVRDPSVATAMDNDPPAPSRQQSSSSKSSSDFQVGARVMSSDRGNGTVVKLVGPWIRVDFGDGIPIACRKSCLRIVA